MKNKSSASFSRSHQILSSLSLLGGSCALVPSAHGALVVTSVNQDGGFLLGSPVSTSILDLPGINDFQIQGLQVPHGSGTYRFPLLVPAPGATYFQNRVVGNYVHIAPAGATWGNAPGVAANGGRFGGRYQYSPGNASQVGPGSSNAQYYAIQFQDTTRANKLLFGWIKGDLVNNDFDNLHFHISEFAYDDSGLPVAMGVGAVPEVTSVVPFAALGALILGAQGVRRWKKAQGPSAAGL